MIYRWTIPTDIETESVLRLRLRTDIPSTSHLSGKFQLLNADAESPSPMRMKYLDITGLSTTSAVGVTLAVTISLLMVCLMVGRLRRRSQRIVLE